MMELRAKSFYEAIYLEGNKCKKYPDGVPWEELDSNLTHISEICKAGAIESVEKLAAREDANGLVTTRKEEFTEERTKEGALDCIALFVIPDAITIEKMASGIIYVRIRIYDKQYTYWFISEKEIKWLKEKQDVQDRTESESQGTSRGGKDNKEGGSEDTAMAEEDQASTETIPVATSSSD